VIHSRRVHAFFFTFPAFFVLGHGSFFSASTLLLSGHGQLFSGHVLWRTARSVFFFSCCLRAQRLFGFVRFGAEFTLPSPSSPPRPICSPFPLFPSEKRSEYLQCPFFPLFILAQIFSPSPSVGMKEDFPPSLSSLSP